MSQMSWWRAYHGLPYDSKLAVVAKRCGVPRAEVLAVWIACLDYASQQDDRGVVEGINAEEIAVSLDLSEETVERVLDGFRQREMIVTPCNASDVSETFHAERISAWDRRQVQRERDDNSSPRVKKHRDAKKAKELHGETPMKHHVTPCNAPEESRGEEIREERNTKHSDPAGSGLSLVPSPEPPEFYFEEPAADVTPSKEIPSDTPSVVRPSVPAKRAKATKRTTEEIKAALGAKRLPWWDGFWSVYPCHEGMRAALDVYEHHVKTRELAVQIYNGAKRYAEQIAVKRRADPDTPVKYAQGWLNDERWRDDAPPPLPVVPSGPQVQYFDLTKITGERV